MKLKKKEANRGPRLTPGGLRPQHPQRAERGGGQRPATRDEGGNKRGCKQQTGGHQQALSWWFLYSALRSCTITGSLVASWFLALGSCPMDAAPTAAKPDLVQNPPEFKLSDCRDLIVQTASFTAGKSRFIMELKRQCAFSAALYLSCLSLAHTVSYLLSLPRKNNRPWNKVHRMSCWILQLSHICMPSSPRSCEGDFQRGGNSRKEATSSKTNDA
jgi:hypothetical protein